MIKVLIIDDSSVQQELLAHILSEDPEIKVIDKASNGEEGARKACSKKPDVIIMDIHMPKMNGIEATKKIMSTCPTPIIILSGSSSSTELSQTFQAIEAGAVSVVEKINYNTGNTQSFIQTVKLMSEVKVVKRYAHLQKRTKADAPPPYSTVASEVHDFRAIAIGASTGGPIVLQEIFKHCPKSFPPMLVVQHITPGFLEGLVEWLHHTTGLAFKIAVHGEPLLPSHVYFAPDNVHMGVDSGKRVVLSSSEPEHGHRPSVSFLLRSVAKAMNQHALGILLTGMGKDGADGLKLMRDAGCFTIAQNEESSLVYGMPAEAVALDAATAVFSPMDTVNFIKKQTHGLQQ